MFSIKSDRRKEGTGAVAVAGRGTREEEETPVSENNNPGYVGIRVPRKLVFAWTPCSVLY